jgi:hypothetical protein
MGVSGMEKLAVLAHLKIGERDVFYILWSYKILKLVQLTRLVPFGLLDVCYGVLRAAQALIGSRSDVGQVRHYGLNLLAPLLCFSLP